MVNIVKFAQFYCIYLLSFAQMSAGEKQIRCFYKKTIYSMVVLPSGIGTLYTVRIFGGLQAAGISRIISCFFEIISAKYRLKESLPLHVTHDCPLSIIDHRACFLKEMYLGTFSHRARSLATLYIIITLERT